MRTALWLYLFMFVALFDLHAQYPILSPFALSLGAAPSFIGWIMGAYSATHLPGNLLAGSGVDRFGSRLFIAGSLTMAGIALLFQSQMTNPWHLLLVRSFSGFVLAFLSPACMALLAKLARDRLHLGHLMTGNGLVHTVASVLSPAAGAFLAAKFGFSTCFVILGWVLIGTGLFAAIGIRDRAVPAGDLRGPAPQDGDSAGSRAAPPGVPRTFYLIPLALSISQGILFFELPLLHPSEQSVMDTGILFSIVSLGAMLTLSMIWLNRLPPSFRVSFGSVFLAIAFFGLAVHWPIPLSVSLFLIGMANGVIFPAISAFLAETSDAGRYGRAFSILSIAFSIGAFLGPVAAGQVRGTVSPYMVAFAALMLSVMLIPPRLHRPAAERAAKPIVK